jgi:hypothetical protein
MNYRAIVSVAFLCVAVSASAQTKDPCLSDRQNIVDGLGTTTFTRGSTLGKDISFDDFMKLKYPRTIRSEKDLPSAIAPNSRIAGVETTLYRVHGFSECGSYCPGGPASYDLYKDTTTTFGTRFTFGYGSEACRVKSPNKKAIDSVDAEANEKMKWTGCVGGCAGFLDSNVTVVGYGYWIESGLTVKAGIFPVVDIIYESADGGTGDGTGGDGGTPTPQPAPPGPTVVLSDELRANPILMNNSSSTTVLFSTIAATGVANDVTLSVQSDSESLIASVSPSTIVAPGSGDAILTVRTTPTTLAGDHVVTITANDGISTSSASVYVTVLCDPPFILGIDQPKGSTIGLGRPAQLSVKASGSGPFTYQWFTGASGLSNFPLPGGTSANFTTSALNDTTSYWVRITNPCGSVNSQTATVNVSASAKPTSRR